MIPLSMPCFNQGRFETLLESGEFDPFWYEETYPDVRLSGLGPAEHYLMIGQRLSRAGTADAARKMETRRTDAAEPCSGEVSKFAPRL